MASEAIHDTTDATEYVLIRLGLDDVFDGQLCRVISQLDSGDDHSVEVEC